MAGNLPASPRAREARRRAPPASFASFFVFSSAREVIASVRAASIGNYRPGAFQGPRVSVTVPRERPPCKSFVVPAPAPAVRASRSPSGFRHRGGRPFPSFRRARGARIPRSTPVRDHPPGSRTTRPRATARHCVSCLPQSRSCSRPFRFRIRRGPSTPPSPEQLRVGDVGRIGRQRHGDGEEDVAGGETGRVSDAPLPVHVALLQTGQACGPDYGHGRGRKARAEVGAFIPRRRPTRSSPRGLRAGSPSAPSRTTGRQAGSASARGAARRAGVRRAR